MSLSNMQGGDMASKIVTVAGTGVPMPSACYGCGGDGDGNEADACFVMCVVLPANGVALDLRTVDIVGPPESLASSRVSRPDPYPPRPVVLT